MREVVPYLHRQKNITSSGSSFSTCVQAGTHHIRRAAAAWVVRRWLLISVERGRLLTGPRPHWWPLLHFVAAIAALCCGLCNLSDNRKQCMTVTKSVVAVIAAMNILPIVLALRWALVEPHANVTRAAFSTQRSQGRASGADTYMVSQGIGLPDCVGRDLPVLVQRRREGQADLPALKKMPTSQVRSFSST